MTKWGLPEWTKEKEYPAPAGPEKMSIWAWEFLRRWPEYRTFWTEKVEPYIGDRGWICHDANGNWWPHLDELETRFGVYSPSPPQSTTPSRFRAYSARRVEYDGRESQQIYLKMHGAAFFYDNSRLTLPQQFAAGLAAALRAQEDRQKSGAINPKTSRKRPEKYVLYLRILDAEEAGAEPKHIRDQLFPDIPDGYPDSKRQKALVDNRKAAQKLRDGGYRSLLIA